MKKQKSDSQADRRDQEVSFASKLQQLLISLFTRDTRLLPIVSITKLFIVYYQIYQLIHIALQFSILSSTNNFHYLLSTAVISMVEVLLYILLRFSTSHLIFKGMVIMGILCLIASIYSYSIVIVNYRQFSFMCDLFEQYHSKLSNVWRSQDICDKTIICYYSQMAQGCFNQLMHMLIFGLFIQCYRQTKTAYEEEQTKKRRKDRYNQLLLKKQIYNELRKV